MAALVSPTGRRFRRHGSFPLWGHILVAIGEGITLVVVHLPLLVHLAVLVAVHLGIAKIGGRRRHP